MGEFIANEPRYTLYDKETQERLNEAIEVSRQFIRMFCTPKEAKYSNQRDKSSYYLKHCVESFAKYTGRSVYVSQSDFTDAALLEGYKMSQFSSIVGKDIDGKNPILRWERNSCFNMKVKPCVFSVQGCSHRLKWDLPKYIQVLESYGLQYNKEELPKC